MQPQPEPRTMKRPGINSLLVELIAAHRTARREDLAPALDACGLHQTGGPIFGVEFVMVDAHNYAPEPGGRPALIVPYFEDGRLLDLVACSLATRTSRTRNGICTALGMDAIDAARWNEEQVRLYTDPLEWLQHGRQGACVIDWRAARHVLADVPAVDCNDNKALADRIDKAMRQPVHMPRLIVGGAQFEASRNQQAATRQPEEAAQAEWAAKTAEHKIRKAATETHPYLDSIGFPKMRGLVHEGLLLVPMRLDGRTVSLQEISADGTARFLTGGRTAGASFTMGAGRAEILCASYAGALSIKAALSALCLPARVTCCFTAENVATVAERCRDAVIFTDNANDLHMRDGLPALQRLLLDLLQRKHSNRPERVA
jgi:hypothetical protein